MKPQELRIGNFVYDNLGGILKIKAISEDSDLSHIKGIPLSPDWLTKFGFSEEQNTSMPYHENYWSVQVDLDSRLAVSFANFRKDYGVYVEYTDSPFPEDECKKYPIAFGIKYVHQLQNLFFSLTGYELKED
jgi:hypothetical protein